MSVEIPKMAIAFGQYGIPQGDVIECRVHLGCTKEVSSFDVLLQNWNGKYSPGGLYPLNVGMDGYICIGRGSNVPQIITCRIESIKRESTATEHYVRVSGRCWGERLFRRTVTKTYENKKGEEIVKDLLDYFVGLSHVRDGTELVENTDTTYTKLEYENTPVWDIIKYIAESADKQGVIGFDFRVAPDGKFEFFPKNIKTSSVSLSEKIEESEYAKKIERIRNRITVYGVAEKPFPLDQDGQPYSDTLTEDLTVSSGTGWGGSDELVHAVYGKWTVLTGSTNLALDTSVKYAGAKSVKVIESGYMYYTDVAFQFNAGKEVNADEFPQVIFAIYIDSAHEQTGYFRAKDINGKYASKRLSFTKQNEWEKIIIPWGSQNAERWDYIESGFDWTKIAQVDIAVDQKYFSSGVWRIDMFHFGYGRWKSIQEDTDSQNAYGLRELVEVDEELCSDNSCERRAKALLNHLKDPAEYLTIKSTVIDYGATPLLPGDKIHVTLPNENVDSDFCIESVEYRVDARTQTLEVSLELGKAPPLLADYLYGLRSTTVTVEKLARTKLGRFKVPTMAGAGVGIHHVGHEAGDENGSQWPSLSVGGWDRISGWISPKHIGPCSDTADIIRFRTKNKAGTAVLEHQFVPTDDGHGILGSETQKWKEINTVYLLLPSDGFMRIRTVGESNPKVELSSNMLQFGPGGGAALDTWLKRVEPGKLELNAELLPVNDNSGYIGSAAKRFAKIYAVEIAVSNMLFNFHLLPDVDATYDLGSPTKRWSNLYLSGLGRLGWLNIGDYTVITSARVLQNVTADAAIITSGQFPLARMPRGTAGYVLEAQGSGYDPMYVNPNGRYTPAGHNHAAGDITSGVLAEDRIPTVFANARTFNGGITMGAALNMNSQSIQNLASLNQCMPPGADQGAVGTTSQYWNCIAGNSVWYKALGQFDMLDDLALIKKIKGNGKVDEKGMPLADLESLPEMVRENGLVNVGALMGLLIGAVKQLTAKVEALEKQLEAKKGVAA